MLPNCRRNPTDLRNDSFDDQFQFSLAEHHSAGLPRLQSGWDG